VLILVLVQCTYIKGTGTSTGTCVVGTCIGTVLVLYSCDVGICTRATGTDTCTWTQSTGNWILVMMVLSRLQITLEISLF